MQNAKWDDLKKYKISKGLTKDVDCIAITKRNYIYFSDSIKIEYKDMCDPHLYIAYSPKNNAIVFRFTSKSDITYITDLKITKFKRLDKQFIKCHISKFIKEYLPQDINLGGHYPVKKEKIDDKNDFFVLYLNEI